MLAAMVAGVETTPVLPAAVVAVVGEERRTLLQLLPLVVGRLVPSGILVRRDIA